MPIASSPISVATRGVNGGKNFGRGSDICALIATAVDWAVCGLGRLLDSVRTMGRNSLFPLRAIRKHAVTTAKAATQVTIGGLCGSTISILASMPTLKDCHT
eukprot:m.53998 g.53998  ORF g.53998 m.53998 type:complete len:102 (+) comp9176_c0_seq1:3093-3398(+)